MWPKIKKLLVLGREVSSLYKIRVEILHIVIVIEFTMRMDNTDIIRKKRLIRDYTYNQRAISRIALLQICI